MDWQPIETAPDDERRVFLWCSDERWNDDRSAKVPVGLVFGRVRVYPNRESRPQGEGMNGDWTFTHWMPLPPPPKTGEGT